MAFGKVFSDAWDHATDTAKQAVTAAMDSMESAANLALDAADAVQVTIEKAKNAVLDKILHSYQTAKQQFPVSLASDAAIQSCGSLAATAENMPPLAQELIRAVNNGASKQEMLNILNSGTTKKQRREARQAIATNASSKAPKTAERFSQDMDGAEKAMLSDHIYTLDKPADKLDDRRQELAEDFEKDSGWSMASPEQLNDLGIDPLDLIIDETNFRAQVYIPDPAVFGPNAKAVLIFRGTESGSDWTQANIPQGINRDSAYYERAVRLGKKLKKDPPLPIEIAGHSLGGGLASAASKAADLLATTFNSAGLHKETVERYGVKRANQGSDDNITRYRIDGELLTFLQEDIPLVSLFAPDAIGNTTHNLPKPKSLTMEALGASTTLGLGFGVGGASAGYAAVKGKEKFDLHGMDMMREGIEERKVADLHSLAQQFNL